MHAWVRMLSVRASESLILQQPMQSPAAASIVAVTGQNVEVAAATYHTPASHYHVFHIPRTASQPQPAPL
jgi:hypothetical protein